jgi:hypothetical protein
LPDGSIPTQEDAKTFLEYTKNIAKIILDLVAQAQHTEESQEE